MYKYLNNVNYPEDIKHFTLEELEVLCHEIRDFIIESISKTGGHLGSSLGCVELAVALHYVFDAPIDKIIWDIGHQAYAHKVLTGRKDLFQTIRKLGGISGFSNPHESNYDDFIGGHSSTSISSAVGIKAGFDLQNKDNNVIAVIGDASITAGMSFEAMNHLGDMNSKVLVILNDNNMSISKTEGAFSKYLSKIKSSDGFSQLRDFAKDILNVLPHEIKEIAKKAENLTRIGKANIFEELGFNYIGPSDGHNVKDLILILENIKNNHSKRPILFHIVTKKGFGHKDVDNSNDALHGVEGIKTKSKNDESLVSNSIFFSEKLKELAKNDNKIVAVSAAMLRGTGLNKFQEEFPERTFDVGIAEQHAVTFGAGLCKAGLKPFVCIYSTFMQRAYDQVIHDVILDSVPLRIVMDRAGFVGQDGSTHHGLYDYAMFLPIPNIVFMAPAFQEDIALMLNLMLDINDKPSFMRFSKLKLNSMEHYKNMGFNLEETQPYKARVLQKGEKVAVICIGDIIHNALEAVYKIKNEMNIKVSLIDMRFAKPFDENILLQISETHDHIILIEEGFAGTFSLEITRFLLDNNALGNLKIHSIYVKENIEYAEVAEQREKAGLSPDSIFNKIAKLI
jgi:1-deoxy-D-xylulose-5-phosphate synthase